MPTRKILCQKYGVSAITINAAWKTLVEEGILELVHGSGAYVCWTPEDDYSQILPGPRPLHYTAKVTYAMLNAKPLYEFMMKTLSETFMSANPDIRIELENIVPDKDDDPWLQRIKTRELPSCGEFFWHAAYARQNALLPLEKLDGFDFLKQELSPHAIFPTADAENQPHIHSILSFSDIPMCVLINQNLLESAGLTLPDQNITFPLLAQLTKRMARFLKGTHDCYAAAMPRPNGWHAVKPYLEYLGQEAFGKDFNANSPESLPAIFHAPSTVKKLRWLGMLRDTNSILYQNGDELFAMGKVGILPFANSWTLQLIDFLNSKFRYKLYSMPHRRKTSWHNFQAGFSVGLFRDGIYSENQRDAAWRWLKYLFKAQSQYIRSQMMNLPVRNDIIPYLQKSHSDFYELSKQSFKNSIPQYDFVGMRSIFSEIGSNLSFFLSTQKSSPEVCLKNIQSEIKALCASNNPERRN